MAPGKSLAAALLLGACACAGAPPAPASTATALPAADHGLEITSLRTTAGGWMLDLRYRVLDPERAARVLSRTVKPVLVDPETGRTYVVPVAGKVGALRQAPRALEAGRSYFVLFKNVDQAVQPGQRLTLVMGDLSQDLRVE